MGGFVAGPGGLMAWMMRRPLLVHEQNAVAGLTNRLLARLAGQVLQAFPQTFKDNAITVGNPVRKDIQQLPEPKMRIESHQGVLRLLVIGGSLGAVRLNEIVPQAVSRIKLGARPEIRHQTGRNNLEATRECYRQLGVEADVKPFIDDMAEAYGWADLVICRAGAMTVFELAAAGVGSILVPYPYAVDDHQTANADYLVNAGAAIIKQQRDLDSEWLSDTINTLTQQRDRLVQMAMAARSMARPGAAYEVANRCMQAGGLS
jgi:UDP-N-acetylglucosamine--N-acetylmuramyl-(pentapeptide) pyrophosphoryl-undecaprenol N-acetylglucosamine transferase